MRKEAEDWDSPKRSIRDSGYIDCWESERSESLSPPRHTRDDSFDSLDSIGSRSRHTPSPDGLLARGSSDGRGSDSECDVPHRKLPDMRRDDMLARRTSCSEPRTAVPFNQYLPNKSNQTSYLPTQLRRQRTEREDSRKSWSNATSPVGGERPFRSMSMIDMRSEEDPMLPPHSQARHELIHGQYTRMKEEESHWQDDLARWKSRRRSVSQDLIKKEEERKMMERLLNKDEGSQRRKSIKTYREIVEDKERRERELHEAYLKAKTPEEAAAVLERYAQRFTISEAIMERLKLPKLLERSVSADPTRLSSSPTTPDPFDSSSSPLQYLRQQSLPAPKFTATVEARVTGYGAGQGDTSRSSRASRLERSAPLLAPKPFGHGRAASAEARSSKWDEMERVNGETDDDRSAREEREREAEREREREEDSSPMLFYPSPSQNTDSDSTEQPTSESQPSDKHTASHALTHTPEPECVDRVDSEAAGQCGMAPEAQSQEEEETQKEQTPSRPTSFPTQLPAEEEELPQARAVSPPVKEEEPSTQALPESERSLEELTRESTDSTVISQNGTVQTTQETQAPSHSDTAATEVSKPLLESPLRTAKQPQPASEDQSKPQPVCEPPATESAEKQHGNEKYRREQEKLKQEWERAQKEVEEEERRYHEEERKILEETVAPLTPHSPMPPSPCWQETTHLPSTPTQHSIVRSLADWEHKQEMEKQTGTLENKRQRENERNKPAGTKEELSQATGSPRQLSGDRLVGQPNGQREGMEGPNQLRDSQSVSWSSKAHQQSSESWKKSASLDCSRIPQPAPGGRRRSVSGKKLCSSCGHPLGKGAAMIIETLSLYFHIQCFKCGICKGQLGDTTTGTDVRIRNGLLNCHQCYIRSRSAGQPTTL